MSDPGSLHSHHLKMLRDESGISDNVIQARGYRTMTDIDELVRLGFARGQCQTPGLLLPLYTTNGQNGLSVYRPDNPRVMEDRRKRKLSDGTYPQRVIKYEFPKDAAMRVDCPPICQPELADPSIPLFITEGQKKADALVSRGACAIALLGVWNFKGKNGFGGTTLLADFDHIAFDDRPVYIVFDSDVMTKPEVRQALNRFTEHLQRKKAHVQPVYLAAANGKKVGVDDWFVANPDKTLNDLMALAEGPRPELKAAPPTIELLDEAPATISRPLALIGGRAYAATWCYVKMTRTESKNRQGEIIRHNPPIETSEQKLFIIRNDGTIWGDGPGDDSYRPLSELGIKVNLPEIPQNDRLLSTPGLKAYLSGKRPQPVDVFQRIVANVDRFIDFDHSLAGQQEMTSLIACYILATWFLDAWNVAGNLWPNGDKGSGKTQLLYVVCELAYLGLVILAGGSYATLRDLADYGATLAFDDAESLTNPRQTDPDKRTLLLAGNRRGNVVTVKEKDGNNGWKTRHVNTFCFRLFSAINLPDNVLASRTIIVPLIRTPDRHRANADPLDSDLWPHERRQLIDDLWCLAVTHLPQMKRYEAKVNQEARLTGRNLEPWRALLAVALWLDEQGVTGLWEQMEKLSFDYQHERPNLELTDLTGLTIRALGRAIASQIPKSCDISDIRDISDMKRVIGKGEFVFLSGGITTFVQKLINEAEMDIDPDKVTSRRIGRALGKMRFEASREPGTGKRGWRVTLDELARWLTSYGITLHDVLGIEPPNVTNVTNDTDVKPKDDLLEGTI